MIQKWLKNTSHIFDEIEGKVNEKLSEEFSRTESRFWGAPSKLDEILVNPHIRTCSVAVPGTTTNGDSRNREPKGDRSPNDPSLEARISSHNSDNLNNTAVEEYPHMVTGGPEEICNRPHIVTAIQEDNP